MEGDPQDHPIWISTEACNENKAAVLVITNGEEGIDLHQYQRCLDMFDGNDEESVKKAQSRVKNYLSQGHSLTYWRQTIKGMWEKKELTEMC
jgi:DNA polymerase-3 subunit chi